MVSFSHDFDCAPYVIHSSLTNYLFIPRDHTVELWDVSTTGSRMVWEAKSPAGPGVTSVCPSRDGHRLLVGYHCGSVRMWSIDLEDLTGNRTDTQDDTYTQQVIGISPSGKVAVTALEFRISQHQNPRCKHWESRSAYRCRVRERHGYCIFLR